MAPEPISPDEEYQRKVGSILALLINQSKLTEFQIIGVNSETVTNVTSTDFPGHYPGEDHTWSVEKLKKVQFPFSPKNHTSNTLHSHLHVLPPQNFRVQLHKNEPLDASFSLIGIDASIANAFRRILIAEIPTLAIESVFVHNNTSIVHDEVLANRLGLVPLTGNLAGLNWLKWYKKPAPEANNNNNSDNDDDNGAADNNTIVLKLQVECTHAPAASIKKGEQDPTKLYHHAHVYARDMLFEPVGRQTAYFPEPDGMIRPVNPDILLAKMRPGQKIDLEMHCIKGIGADHAKFSPVATASYRLLPTITITRPILGADAKKFARCFPKGVIAVQEVTTEEAAREGSGYEGQVGEKKAVVQDPFRDTVSRECLRHDEFQGKVKLGRVRDHFIFTVESTGQFHSDLLFLESVKTLKLKCARLKRSLVNVMR